jgi:hypothetical protein
MPLPENDNNESASRVQDMRLYGGAGAIAGGAALLLSWAVPTWVADKVAKCNTVAGDAYARTHAETGFGCTTANFVTDFAWAGYLLGVCLVIGGLIAFFKADDPEFQEEYLD